MESLNTHRRVYKYNAFESVLNTPKLDLSSLVISSSLRILLSTVKNKTNYIWIDTIIDINLVSCTMKSNFLYRRWQQPMRFYSTSGNILSTIHALSNITLWLSFEVGTYHPLCTDVKTETSEGEKFAQVYIVSRRDNLRRLVCYSSKLLLLDTFRFLILDPSICLQITIFKASTVK